MEEEMDLDEVVNDALALCKRCGNAVKVLAVDDMDKQHKFLSALMIDNSLYWLSQTIRLLADNIMDLEDQLEELQEDDEEED